MVLRLSASFVDELPGGMGRISLLGNASDDFDLEIETGEPSHAERSPVWIGRRREYLGSDRHDRPELALGISMEGGHVDNVF